MDTVPVRTLPFRRRAGAAVLSERFAMATAVEAVIEAARDGQTPELPAVAEDLARDDTLFGTYDEAQDAIDRWFAAGADSINLVLPEEELTEVLDAAASRLATTVR